MSQDITIMEGRHHITLQFWDGSRVRLNRKLSTAARAAAKKEGHGLDGLLRNVFEDLYVRMSKRPIEGRKRRDASCTLEGRTS